MVVCPGPSWRWGISDLGERGLELRPPQSNVVVGDALQGRHRWKRRWRPVAGSFPELGGLLESEPIHLYAFLAVALVALENGCLGQRRANCPIARWIGGIELAHWC